MLFCHLDKGRCRIGHLDRHGHRIQLADRIDAGQAGIGGIGHAQGVFRLGQGGMRTLQTRFRLRHIGLGIRPHAGAVTGLGQDGFMPGHIVAGQFHQLDTAQQVDMGDDAVQGKGRGPVEDPGLDGIQGCLGGTHAAARSKAVPDGLYQLGGDTAHAQPLVIKVQTAGRGVAQDTHADLPCDVHTRTEAGTGLVELMLQDRTVLLDAHQAAMVVQHTVHGIVYCDMRRAVPLYRSIPGPCRIRPSGQQTACSDDYRSPRFVSCHNVSFSPTIFLRCIPIIQA